MNDWALVEHTHTFPEWKKNQAGNSSRLIPVADILEAVGLAADADQILRELKEEEALDACLRQPPPA